MTDDPLAAPTARETVLKVLRAASAEAWQVLFDAHFRKGPAWIEEKTPGFETLLLRTAAEGPATLFLFPDEFFPLSALLDEPIARAFNRWNRAVERLQDPKLKESEKGDVVSDLSRGDFWNRSTAIVGAQIVDALVRTVGRDEYLKALAAGPRSVATLYLQASKGTKLPAFGKAAKKFLEARPPG